MAELVEAQRNGDVGTGDAGPKLNELFPNRYPTQPVAHEKTRQQVLAELAEAQRTGDIVVGDGMVRKLNEMFPARYPHN